MDYPEVVVEDGVQKIILEEKHLVDFNKLIQFVRTERVGAKEGVFKMELHPSLELDPAASEVIKAVISHFSVESNRPAKQCFFYGSQKDDVYGYKETQCSSREAGDFARVVTNPVSYINPVTCCTREYNGYQGSADQLLQHYWNFIRNQSVISAGLEVLLNENVEVVPLDEQKVLHSSTTSTTDSSASYLVNNSVTLRGSTDHQHPILYGSDIPVSDKGFVICHNFSLSALGTILDVCKVHCPRVSSPRLIVGVEHSTFVWHIENGVLWSINFLHHGACKVWFVVPPEYYDLLVYHLALAQLPLDVSHVTCSNILRHYYVVISHLLLQKLGVSVCMVIQRPRQFVVTYPFSAHSGFNIGPNVAEAVNFGDDEWVELGVNAPRCNCLKRSQVHLRMTDIIAVAKPHLLDVYLRRNPSEMNQIFPQPRFLQLKFASDYASSSKVSLNMHPLGDSMHKRPLQTETAIEVYRSVNTVLSTDSDGADEDGKSKYVFCGARGMLKCPECDQTYKEGRSKLHRLLNHAKIKHSKSCPQLLESISLMYPPKKTTSNTLTCRECGKSFAGNISHLKLHHARMHTHKVFCGPSNKTTL